MISELRRRCMFPGGCDRPATRGRLCGEHFATQAARFGLDTPGPRLPTAPMRPTREPPKLHGLLSLNGAQEVLALRGWELVVRPVGGGDQAPRGLPTTKSRGRRSA